MTADVIKEVKDGVGNTSGRYVYWCPGCNEFHGVWVAVPNNLTGAKWEWNGDKVKPTFAPSIWVRPDSGRGCHFHIVDGQIAYLPDSHHSLAGKTVPMVPVEEKFST